MRGVRWYVAGMSDPVVPAPAASPAPDRPRGGGLALHWQILIGLALGVIVGLLINAFWTPRTWFELGVTNPRAFLDPKLEPVTYAAPGSDASPTAPVHVPGIGERYPYQLTPEQAEGLGLEPAAANEAPALLARAARFARGLMRFLGDVFLRGLQFIAVPIVLFSLISGVASVKDAAKLGRIGVKTVVLYLCTTALAITIGLVLANLVRPGSGIPEPVRDALAAAGAGEAQSKIDAARSPSFWQTLLDIVPKNPFEAIARGDMLPIVLAALLVGLALTGIDREKARIIHAFFDGMTDVIVRIVRWVLLLAPYAVFALITLVVADLGLGILGSLAKYAGVVIGGIAIMLFGVYPAMMAIFRSGVGYRRFFSATAPAQLLAFSSASSSATLPVTMKVCRENLRIRDDVASFVLPIGATVNMDGTALYQGVATMFIAQLFGIELGLGEQLTIVLTATLASIGTAGVPGVGIIMLVIVMQSVKIPAEVMAAGIGIIFSIDRILDMCRTCCNVTGDMAVCTVVAASEGEIER